MNRTFKHPLYVALFPDYAPRLDDILSKLQHYRVEERIDWRARVETWLSNFEGLHDQRIALDLLEKLRVVSESEIVDGCRALLERIRSVLPAGTREWHFAHETSGHLLVRVLEKDLGIRSYAVLRQSDFVELKALKRLRDGDTVVIWDRFNGTSKQLSKLIATYRKAFRQSGKRIHTLQFAYIAGHTPRDALPSDVVLHRWLEDIPMASEEEQTVCARYAREAGATKTNQRYETGALLTFADNPPNNIPLVLRAPPSKTWFTLLDRKETPKP